MWSLINYYSIWSLNLLITSPDFEPLDSKETTEMKHEEFANSTKEVNANKCTVRCSEMLSLRRDTGTISKTLAMFLISARPSVSPR